MLADTTVFDEIRLPPHPHSFEQTGRSEIVYIATGDDAMQAEVAEQVVEQA